jgi:hypothetical protein
VYTSEANSDFGLARFSVPGKPPNKPNKSTETARVHKMRPLKNRSRVSQAVLMSGKRFIGITQQKNGIPST